jgi:NADH:ubiquinone oxidoreductase subunit 6 (subunit J)
MSLYTFLFYFFEVCAGAAAIAMIFSRNLFYAALLLLACLMSVAGLYVLAWAEFVAVTQILIYAGGVLVLILFGIMLTAKMGKHAMLVQHVNLFSGAIVAIGFIGLMVYALSGQFKSSPQHETRLTQSDTIETIGGNLMTTFLLPFEIAGILLLVALVGAAVIASHKSGTHASR